MKPEKEQITPENVEEQIQHALHMSGVPNPSASAEERVIRELYHMYNGEEAIMARTWQRLVERHPEVVDPIDSFDTRPQRVIQLPPLPQSRPPRNSWRQRAMILVMVAICLLVIGASAFVYYQKLAAPVPKRNVVPIQGFHLVDSKGRVLYQTDGQKTQDFSQDQHTADFVQYALAQLASDLHVKPEALLKMNIRAVTTLDLDVQSKAYQSAQQQIQSIKNTKNVSDSAVVVLDYRTGAIRALFGSLNPQGGAYNVATRNGRQMGSAFKPFVYAVAFDHGISPGDVVNDVKTTFPPSNYTPQNYDGQFHGPMSYRTALQNGYNIPAIKLLEQMQVAPTVQNIAALGVPLPPASELGLSMALGTSEVTVLDATAAYGTMANQGIRVAPTAIEQVTDASGRVIFRSPVKGTRALSKAAAFMITDVLSDNTARVPEYGSCSPLLLYTTSQAACQAGNPGQIIPAAASAGSTNSFRDSWTIGYTNDYVIGVWAGNDNYQPMVNVTGADGAAQIWHELMLRTEQGMPISPFPGPPANVVKKTVSDLGLTTTDWHLK